MAVAASLGDLWAAGPEASPEVLWAHIEAAATQFHAAAMGRAYIPEPVGRQWLRLLQRGRRETDVAPRALLDARRRRGLLRAALSAVLGPNPDRRTRTASWPLRTGSVTPPGRGGGSSCRPPRSSSCADCLIARRQRPPASAPTGVRGAAGDGMHGRAPTVCPAAAGFTLGFARRRLRPRPRAPKGSLPRTTMSTSGGIRRCGGGGYGCRRWGPRACGPTALRYGLGRLA